jgi:hypothetical protein
MLDTDPNKGMSAADLVRHQWLANMLDTDIVERESRDDAMKPMAEIRTEVPVAASSIGQEAAVTAHTSLTFEGDASLL